MIDDSYLHAAARLLIERHGAKASQRATQRANDLGVEGDNGNSEIWRRIARAIEELQHSQGHHHLPRP